jgi:aspartyl-tRNA(Asn)/glutamyl-tRNA(Gln) amidotransferase subunit A
MTPPLSFDQTVELDRDSKSQRIDRRWEAARDDSLNCFISISEAAPPLPEGPLTGLVFGVKDNIDVEGFPTTLGSLLGDPNPQTGSADVVRTVQELGATCIGKQNLGELATDAYTINPHYGTTLNPWDTTRMVGGSSGGSAAAVAAGLVDFAFGSDSAGSVRIPASMCGIAAFRPSHSMRWQQGLVGGAWSIDSIGLMGPSLGDLHWLVRQADFVPALPSASSEPVRVGVVTDDSMGAVHSDVADVFGPAVDRLKEDPRLRIEEIRLDGLELGPFVAAVIAYVDLGAQHAASIRRQPQDYGEPARHIFRLGNLFSGNDYVTAGRMRQLIVDRYREATEGVELVVTPTLPVTASLIGDDPVVPGDDTQLALFCVIRFTALANLAGIPSASIPIGLSAAGLPVGLQVMGRRHEDARMLAAGDLIEEIAGQHLQPPGWVG